MLRTIIVTALFISSWLCSALALRQLPSGLDLNHSIQSINFKYNSFGENCD